MKKKGFIAGTFDCFHVGHQWLLWKSQVEVDELVVIIARDKTVKTIKQKIPKNSQGERLKRLQEESLPNAVFRLGREDADFFQTLREEAPDILFLGYDQSFDEKKCNKLFPNLSIVRLEKFFPEFFKSSYF